MIERLAGRYARIFIRGGNRLGNLCDSIAAGGLGRVKNTSETGSIKLNATEMLRLTVGCGDRSYRREHGGVGVPPEAMLATMRTAIQMARQAEWAH